MPRLPRLDAPGVLHHIMIRGIERRRIFNDDKDRENFIDRLSILLPETGTTCYAWALMPNHAHFIFRSGDSGIPTLYRLDRKYILGKGRQKDRVEARDLVCYFGLQINWGYLLPTWQRHSE